MEGDDLKLKERNEPAAKKLPILGSMLTPEKIVGKMFGLYMKAHLFHWNSGTIGQHELLNELYPKIVEMNDAITEHVLGLQIPKKLDEAAVAKATALPSEKFSDSSLLSMINEGCAFAEELCDYAEERDVEQLCNLASELSGAFVKARLFTTYK